MSADGKADGDANPRNVAIHWNFYPKGISSFSPALPRQRSGYAGLENHNSFNAESVASTTRERMQPFQGWKMSWER
jgi:hypothetical protein